MPKLAAILLPLLILGALVGITTPQEAAPRLHRVPLTGVGGLSRNGGDVIPGCSLLLDDYKLNPVVVVDHFHSATAIMGRVVSFEIVGDFMYVEIDFIDKPAGWEGPWMPDQIEAAFDAGVGGVSVYIGGVVFRDPTDDERERWPGVTAVLVEGTLLELSVVAIPAFAEAVSVDRLP